MLFQFLKYLKPISYFNLKNQENKFIFPKIENLPKEIICQLDCNKSFISKTAEFYDMSWQAIHKGYIGNSEKIELIKEVPVHDEYIFVRRYFSSFWVFYCLVIRVLTFHNPIKEIYFWMKTRKTQRLNYYKSPITHNDLINFKSKLVNNDPKISVIIPTLDRYNYLKNILKDLEAQEYKNFEVIIVDQSDPFQKEFYEDFNLEIHLIHQKEKALWLARNTAVKASTNKLIAFSEDDVRINKDWLLKHIICLDYFNADISAGVFYPEGGSLPRQSSFFSVAQHFASGNALVYKDVFKKVGLFDRQYEKGRAGDAEFGLRCFVNGLKSISNPESFCIDVKAPSGGLRLFGSWDSYRTVGFLKPKPVPSVLYQYRKYYGKKYSIFSVLKTLPQSMVPYKFKGNKFFTILAYIGILFIWPLVLYQVFKSWKLSSVQLNKGAIIEQI